MKVDEYRESHNHAPFMLYEFAEGALEVEDAPQLSEAARNYLDAKGRFEAALETHGIEEG